MKSRLLLPLALAVVFVVLFDSPLVYPFRLFVVFLHELGHGVVALLTGGRIVSIAISSDEGGVCVTQGGVPFLVLNAGYLGSLLFGALFLLLGARRRNARPVVLAIGAFTLLAALVYVRSWFGFAYTLGAGLVLSFVSLKLRPAATCASSGFRSPASLVIGCNRRKAARVIYTSPRRRTETPPPLSAASSGKL